MSDDDRLSIGKDPLATYVLGLVLGVLIGWAIFATPPAPRRERTTTHLFIRVAPAAEKTCSNPRCRGAYAHSGPCSTEGDDGE